MRGLMAAVQQHDGNAAAMALAGAVMRALWAEDRHIADPATLAALLAALGLPAQRLDDAKAAAAQQGYDANTERAITLVNAVNVELAGITVTGFTGPLLTTEHVTGTGLNIQ